MTHLELLNVALTWRFQQPGWPPVLVQSGYLVQGVGVGLALPGGRRVVPDILANCAERGFTLLIEVKSGGSPERDQLERMLAMTPEHLRDLNHFTIPDPSKHDVQVLYMCHATDLDAFKRALVGRPAAAVAFDGSRFALGGSLADNVLVAEIAKANVDPEAVPAAIVPFDHESPPAVIARCVLPEVVAALVAGTGMITSEGIVQRTHSVVYEVMRPTGAKSELAQVQDRVTRALSDAARNEFEEWLERPTPQPTWRFKKALASEPSGKTRDLKALRSAADALLKRLGAPDAQLPLFDEEAQ